MQVFSNMISVIVKSKSLILQPPSYSLSERQKYVLFKVQTKDLKILVIADGIFEWTMARKT